jgi:hypothetical protein
MKEGQVCRDHHGSTNLVRIAGTPGGAGMGQVGISYPNKTPTPSIGGWRVFGQDSELGSFAP